MNNHACCLGRKVSSSIQQAIVKGRSQKIKSREMKHARRCLHVVDCYETKNGGARHC